MKKIIISLLILLSVGCEQTPTKPFYITSIESTDNVFLCRYGYVGKGTYTIHYFIDSVDRYKIHDKIK